MTWWQFDLLVLCFAGLGYEIRDLKKAVEGVGDELMMLREKEEKRGRAVRTETLILTETKLRRRNPRGVCEKVPGGRVANSFRAAGKG
jgi:hypothetical protein